MMDTRDSGDSGFRRLDKLSNVMMSFLSSLGSWRLTAAAGPFSDCQ